MSLRMSDTAEEDCLSGVIHKGTRRSYAEGHQPKWEFLSMNG